MIEETLQKQVDKYVNARSFSFNQYGDKAIRTSDIYSLISILIPHTRIKYGMTWRKFLKYINSKPLNTTISTKDTSEELGYSPTFIHYKTLLRKGGYIKIVDRIHFMILSHPPLDITTTQLNK